MRSVLVTRPQPAADEFAEKLRREGFIAHVAPMMTYVGVSADLSVMDQCQALIFTSAQAVQLFAGMVADRTKPVLAVGDATAATAARAGFPRVYSARGNSVDVAALIRAEASKLGLKKVLHLCSADTPDDIGPAVASLGVEVVRRPVYKAELVEDISDDVAAALQRGAIDTVLLFSARTAENFVRVLIKRGLRNISPKLEVICISDPVAGALRELPWRAVRIALQPRMEAVMHALREQEKGSRLQDRRQRGPDRRQRPAYIDERGQVRSDAYTGPERRVMSRRAHEQRQKDLVWQEKVKFMNRAMLTAAFMFIAIVGTGVLLMAPEYAKLGNKSWTAYMKMRLHQWMNDEDTTPIGAAISGGIEHMQTTTGGLTSAVGDIAAATMDAVTHPGTSDLTQVLGNVMALRSHEGGEASVGRAAATLRKLLGSPDYKRTEDLNASIDVARGKDPAIGSLLGSMKKEDLAAGAMLLVLNEFRSNVDNHRPYAEDLALLRRFAGNNPAMNRAIQRLAPYAETGVMSREALQAELKGLAGDIVKAKLQGEDISVQQAAQARFEKLARAGRAEDVKGETPDAVVARAQILLDKGDVKGAMRELQSLDAESAGAAKPWMDNANGYMAAESSSDELTGGLLQMLGTGAGASAEGLMETIKQMLGGASVPYVSPALTRGSNGGKGVVTPP